MSTDSLRNATLSDLAELLRDQNSRKLDVVVPADKIRSMGGIWVIDDTLSVVTEDGVTSLPGAYRPTAVADEGIAAKLDIPRAYLRRMRDSRVDLYDANVNGWLHGRQGEVGGQTFTEAAADRRSFLVRAFTDGDGGVGVARAFLSDQYRIVDHLDVLTATLDGIRASGVDVEIGDVDLTDRRMYVKVHAPAVAELAPALLQGYRSPFTGAEGTDNPTVFAGFVLSNSETGGGAASLTPRLVIQICGNGMTITQDALRAVHLGSKLEQGVIRWSTETQQANLDLVRNQARDAVATFLHPDYLRAKIAQLSANADQDATVAQVQTITKTLSYTTEQTDSVLDFFVKGGQATLGGVAQAITAAAQSVTDADDAAAMENDAASLLLAA